MKLHHYTVLVICLLVSGQGSFASQTEGTLSTSENKNRFFALLQKFLAKNRQFIGEHHYPEFAVIGTEKQDSLLNNLVITTSIDEMEKAYAQYSVIPLRQWVREKQLVLGCGNTPTYESYFGTKEHAHEGAVTVDVDLRMNPTVLGSTLDKSTYAYFQDKGILFDDIYRESAKTAYTMLKPLLAERGTITDRGAPIILLKRLNDEERGIDTSIRILVSSHELSGVDPDVPLRVSQDEMAFIQSAYALQKNKLNWVGNSNLVKNFLKRTLQSVDFEVVEGYTDMIEDTGLYLYEANDKEGNKVPIIQVLARLAIDKLSGENLPSFQVRKLSEGSSDEAVVAVQAGI